MGRLTYAEWRSCMQSMLLSAAARAYPGTDTRFDFDQMSDDDMKRTLAELEAAAPGKEEG